MILIRDCFELLMQRDKFVCLVILTSCSLVGCSTQEDPRSPRASTSHSILQSNARKICELLERALENKEPSLGHLSVCELEIASYGSEAIRHVIPWMTSEDPSKRFVAARILERVSIVQFGWREGAADSDWRKQDWLEFWNKHGNYSPDLASRDATVAQSLWDNYVESETESEKKTRD